MSREQDSLFNLKLWDYKAKSIGARLPAHSHGVYPVSLEMDLNQAYIFTLRIDPQLCEYWEVLANDPFMGIVLETDDFTLGFIKSRQREVRTSRGEHLITFYSASWRLKDEGCQWRFDDLWKNRSLDEFVQGIAPELVFMKPFSGDLNITYESQIAESAFALLQNVTNRHGRQFRDCGIDAAGLPIVEYGDFRYLPQANTGKNEVINLCGEPFAQFANDDRQGDIVDYTATYNNNFYTHIYVYADLGTGGASKNTRTHFSSTNPPINMDPDFPIVQLSDGEYYIQNNEAYRAISERCEFKRFQPVAQGISLLDQDGVEFDAVDLLQRLYDEGKSLLRKDGEEITYNVETRYNKIILPGTRVNIKVREQAKKYDGSTVDIMEIEKSMIARDLRYDEETLSCLYA